MSSLREAHPTALADLIRGKTVADVTVSTYRILFLFTDGTQVEFTRTDQNPTWEYRR